MPPDIVYRRLKETRSYLGWDDHDERRIRAVAPILAPCCVSRVDDFYASIDEHTEGLLPNLRSLEPEVGVIVTGFSEVSGIVKTPCGGATDCIFTPITPDFLRANMAPVVEGRRLRQQCVKWNQTLWQAPIEKVPCVVSRSTSV